jgi:hypothetical protein
MFKDLFSNSDNVSMIRLCLFFCVIISGLSALLGIFLNRDLVGIAAIISALLSFAYIGKSIQKFAENKGDKDDKGN